MMHGDLTAGLGLIAGITIGVCFGALWQRRHLRRPQRSTDLLWSSEMVWGLCDDLIPEIVGADLAERLQPRDGLLPMLLQGVVFRKTAQGQKALRVHQSLLARPGVKGDTLKIIYLHCAMDALVAGDLELARQYWQRLGLRWKRTHTARLLKARLEFRSGHLKSASDLFGDLRKAFPHIIALKADDLECQVRMAQEERHWGKQAAARKRVDEILAQDPVHAQGLLLLTDICLDSRDFERARFCLLQYVQHYGEIHRDLEQRVQRLKDATGEVHETLAWALQGSARRIS